MIQNTHWKQLARNWASILFGNALYSLAVALFLEPAGLITGGATGIALAIGRLTGVPVSGLLLFINLAMLVWGWAVLGRAFALNTLASSVLSPAFLGLFEGLLAGRVLTEDIFLCTVFAGLGIGVALGIVIRSGASTGGLDIPPLVLNKWFKLPVSATMLAFDIIVLLMQAVFSPMPQVLYGIVMVLIHTIVMDKMLMMGASRTEVKIIRRHLCRHPRPAGPRRDHPPRRGRLHPRVQRRAAEHRVQPGTAPAGKAGPQHRPHLLPHREPCHRGQRPGLLDG